ncbi:MAG: hypothetical protein ACI8X3_003446, partial [Saprospiraceae bacterium]
TQLNLPLISHLHHGHKILTFAPATFCDPRSLLGVFQLQKR